MEAGCHMPLPTGRSKGSFRKQFYKVDSIYDDLFSKKILKNSAECSTTRIIAHAEVFPTKILQGLDFILGCISPKIKDY